MSQSSRKQKMFRSCAAARETRSSSFVSLISGHKSDQVSPSNMTLGSITVSTQTNTSPSSTHNLSNNITPTMTSGTGEGSESDSNAGTEEDEDDPEEDDDEPKEIAPSDSAVDDEKNQTGRSNLVSTLRVVGVSKKRTWSTSSDEEEMTGKHTKVAKFIDFDPELSNQSDDEVYNAVDLISDSDEEEPDLEQMEEKMIIDSEEEHVGGLVPRVHPTSPPSTSTEDWQGFDLVDDTFFSDVPFFDEEIRRTDLIDLYHDATPIHSRDSPSPQTIRRVRFADDVSHSSTSRTASLASVDNDIFPDLFMHQDSLDPSFRRLIENDFDEEAQSLTDGEGSYWDLEDNEDFELEKHGLKDDSTSNGGSSSGYETDEGETTDEEVLPPKTVNRPQSLLRLNSSGSARGPSIPKPVSNSFHRDPVTPTPTMRRQGPSMASWVVDPTKPIAVIDSTGKTMLIYPAPRSLKKSTSAFLSSLSSSTTTSPRNSFVGVANVLDDSENDPSDISSQEQYTTILGSGANVMMPGLLHGASGMEHILGGQVLGPPEAFYPFTSIDSNGLVMEDIPFNEEDNDSEHMLNLQDFIDFGDSSSDSDNGESQDAALLSVGSPDEQGPFTPMTSENGGVLQNQHSSTQHLLQHFDRGVVSSFRRNQTRHQSLLRRQNINTSLVGIKGGRHFAASNPISPLRKRKASRSLSSTFSPLSGVTTKRKVTNKAHKRTKSVH